MALSGRAAAEHPDTDRLKPVVYGIVTHAVRQAGKPGTARRISAGPGVRIGHIDPGTGAYQAAANAMTEDERREAGLRRNGRRR